ncbi:MAG: VTT domain-containing protein, partial [Deltaproteobacteria bacterium]|nr:VTT domain-containing protein [Deltaproteobacteria bacterium]
MRLEEWAAALISSLAGLPLAQGLLVAVLTLVLEDPVTIGSGLLVASGRLGHWVAFAGLSAGIAVGDTGLYLLGRLARGPVGQWRFLRQAQAAGAGEWLEQNVAATVLVSRFVPGMRLPTYLGAGLLRVPAWKFLAAAVAASLLWTTSLLGLTIGVGRVALRNAGPLRAPLGVGLVALAFFGPRLLARRKARRPGSPSPSEGPVRSSFELWPPAVFYLPVGLYCLWLAVRFRGLTLPTAANPSIYSGGLIRESKGQILSLIPPSEQFWVAPWAVYE